jgi:uncharacterized damage-inducible protein DinB
MNKQEIELLYRYNRWANATQLKAAAALSPEQLTKKLGGSFPSVLETLVHIMGAEWIWLMRWKGTSPPALLPASEFRDLNAVKAKWREIEADQTDFIGTVTEAALQVPLKYVNTKGQPYEYPLGRVMQHLVNHGSYHRGQLTNFLRQLGAEPAPTDLLVYFDTVGNAG